MEKIIGREEEIARLTNIASSNRPEFVAIYGRRRVGKTFLIKNLFRDNFAFYTTGVIAGDSKDEMDAFNSSLVRYGYMGKPAKKWMEAFYILSDLLAEKSKADKKKRQIVFIDELPCFDTPGSRFIQALDYFWNSSASWMDNVMLIVCGSATSWMLKNLIFSHGGLYKRLTYSIPLHPFDLATTEKYIKSRSKKWDRHSILQLYSIFGGIPYYLSLIDYTKSVAENTDLLLFSENAALKGEYDALYRSVFSNPGPYMTIISALAKNKTGMSKEDLAETLGIHNNGHLGEILKNLASCDFIRSYRNGIGKNNKIYQLMDFFTLFYAKFGSYETSDDHFWRKSIGTPMQNSFYGLTFERICMCHFRQIIRALGISGVRTEFYSWRSRKSSPAVQIDIVIERGDGIVNICEVKYSGKPYILTKEEADKIVRRDSVFREENPKKSRTQTVMVTSSGLERNIHSASIEREVSLNDLFE